MSSINSSTYRRANLKIAPGAVVCEESILKGDITIGAKTIIHPRACILAEAGPIIIGEGNIIEEMATITNRLPSDASEPTTIPVQIIGNYNVFETDCICEAFKMGDNNILEIKAHVAREVELTNGCVIGAACSLMEPEIIAENTIVYGSECQRREMNDKPYDTAASDWTVGLSAEGTSELSSLPEIKYEAKNGTHYLILCSTKIRKSV